MPAARTVVLTCPVAGLATGGTEASNKWARRGPSSAAGVKNVAAGAENVTVPESVRIYLADSYASVLAQQNELTSTGESGVNLEHPLLYVVRVAYPGTKSPTWLVGLRIARVGNGQVPVTRAAIVGELGRDNPRRQTIDLPEACAGDDCLAFEVRDGSWLFAMSYNEGRRAADDIRVFSATSPPRQVLHYQPPIKAPAWYSDLHFADADGDGLREICVERTVRDFDARQRWKEYCIYRYDLAKNAFGAEERISPAEFRRIVKSVDGDEEALRLRQHGPPYEQRVDDELEIIEHAPTPSKAKDTR